MKKKTQIIEIDVEWSALPNIIPIIFPLVRESLLALGKSRHFEILCKRYGLNGEKSYTLQDIGHALGITRERVRQVEQNAEGIIKSIICGQQSKIKVLPGLTTEVSDLSNAIIAIGPLFTEDEMIETIKSRYQYITPKSEYSAIRLLLSTLGFSALPDKPPRPNAKTKLTWITDPNFDRQLFFEARSKVDDVLLKSITPLNFFDLMVNVNKGRRKPFQQPIVRLAIKTMGYIDQVDDDSYQVSFASLKSLADKAFRILYEQNNAMKLRELHREVNHRLVISQSGLTAPMRSISQQLINDGRFKTIGRAGWILSNWDGIATNKTVGIIQEYFYQNKTEASFSDIYNYVIKKRPTTKIKSVRSFLAQKDKFTRVSEDRFVPVDWKQKPYIPTRKVRKPQNSTLRSRIQAAVQEFFHVHSYEWIKLRDLKVYVLKKCVCKGQTFYHYLSEMPDIIKEKRPDGEYRRLLTPLNDHGISKVEEDWKKIISEGETKTVEFKRAAKWNDYEKKPDGNMIQQIIIEVAGFMNSDFDGKIFIGIDDKTKEIIGIEEDISVADKGKPNRDGYSLFLCNAVLSKLGKDLGPLFETRFQVLDGREVCCINVSSAPRIVYYEGQLYLRGNGQTNLLNAAEAVEFAKQKRSRQERI